VVPAGVKVGALLENPDPLACGNVATTGALFENPPPPPPPIVICEATGTLATEESKVEKALF
jgi:hypothetical protein